MALLPSASLDHSRTLCCHFSRLAQVGVVLKKPALQHSFADRGTVRSIFDRSANLADVVLLIKTAPHSEIQFRAPRGT